MTSAPLHLRVETPSRNASPAAVTAERRRAASNAPRSAAPRWEKRLSRSLVLLDLILASIAGLVALLIRFGEDATPGYRILTVLFPLGFVASVALARGYEQRFLGTGSEEYRRVTDAGVRFLALAAFTAYGLQYDVARGYVLLAFPLAILLLLIGRHSARQVLRRARRHGRLSHNVLVLGRERSAAELIRQLRLESDAGFNVVGVCIDGSQAKSVEGVSVLGTASHDVLTALRQCGADTVAVAPWSPLTQQELRRLSWQLEGTGIALVVAPSLTDVAGPRIHIRPVSGLPLLHVEQPELTGGRRAVKWVFDVVTSGAALLLLLPVLLVIALAVKLSSPGPVLFKQERVGKSGSTFRIWKFRSMCADAEAVLPDLLPVNEVSDGVLFKMRRDPRVTPLGERLRRFSLDELPQLVNVLRGEMSLVGPRPPLPSEVARYENDVHRRLLVKPGLTGLWQISGRSDLTWEEAVRLDLHYVENWSLAFDLMIIWKTVFAVLRREGAY